MIRWAIKLWRTPVPRGATVTLYSILSMYCADEIILAWGRSDPWAMVFYAAMLLIAVTVLWLHWHRSPLRMVAPFCKATGAPLGTRVHRAEHHRLDMPCRRVWRQQLPRVEHTRRRTRVNGGAR